MTPDRRRSEDSRLDQVVNDVAYMRGAFEQHLKTFDQHLKNQDKMLNSLAETMTADREIIARLKERQDKQAGAIGFAQWAAGFAGISGFAAFLKHFIGN